MLVTPSNPHPPLPTAETLKKLDYLNAVVHESLRCFPPVAGGGARQLSRDVEVGGATLPKGQLVVLSVWPAHYSTDSWGEDAGEWRPERWLEGPSVAANRKDKDRNLRWLPFLQGTQNCIGQHLAMVRPLVAVHVCTSWARAFAKKQA